MTNDFNWRGQPSKVAQQLKPKPGPRSSLAPVVAHDRVIGDGWIGAYSRAGQSATKPSEAAKTAKARPTKDGSQYATIGELLARPNGATPYELQAASRSLCVHKRMSEMRLQGWVIRREPIPGEKYGRYIGTAPKAAG